MKEGRRLWLHASWMSMFFVVSGLTHRPHLYSLAGTNCRHHRRVVLIILLRSLARGSDGGEQQIWGYTHGAFCSKCGKWNTRGIETETSDVRKELGVEPLRWNPPPPKKKQAVEVVPAIRLWCFRDASLRRFSTPESRVGGNQGTNPEHTSHLTWGIQHLGMPKEELGDVIEAEDVGGYAIATRIHSR